MTNLASCSGESFSTMSLLHCHACLHGTESVDSSVAGLGLFLFEFLPLMAVLEPFVSIADLAHCDLLLSF